MEIVTLLLLALGTTCCPTTNPAQPTLLPLSSLFSLSLPLSLSQENALWQLSNKNIGREIFVGCVVSEFKFDRRLRMEEHLTRFYDTFDGSLDDEVDYRLLLSTYLILTLFKVVATNPRHLFFLLLDLFTDPFAATVPRRDVLNLVSLCAADGDEVRASRNRLDDALGNVARLHGLKSDFRLVERKVLDEVFEVNPGILLTFKEQCWLRLSDDQRLYILGKKEEESAQGFEYQDTKFKQRQAMQLWKNCTTRKFFKKWDVYKETSLRTKSQKLFLLCQKAKRTLRNWNKQTQLNLAKKERRAIARAMAKLINKRATFLKWKRLVIGTKKMLRACKRYDNAFKRYGDGLGHLRYGWYRWKMRIFLNRWDDETKFMQRMEAAAKWNLKNFKRHNWMAFKGYLQQCIVEKYKELDAVDRQKWIMMKDKETEEDIARIAMEAELAALKKKEEEELKAKVEAKRKAFLMAQRRKANSQANDRIVRQVQQEERRKRVEKDMTDLCDEWEDEWDGENKKRRIFNPNHPVYHKSAEMEAKYGADACHRCGRPGHVFKSCYFPDHAGKYLTVKQGDTIASICDAYFEGSRLKFKRWNQELEFTPDVQLLVVGSKVVVLELDDGNWHALQGLQPGVNLTWDHLEVKRKSYQKFLSDKKDKDAKDRILKAMVDTKEEFFQPPTLENKVREAFLCEPGNIALALIDSRLFEKGLLPKQLFERFHHTEGGYITWEEFKIGVESFNLGITANDIKAILRAIDPENDGYLDNKVVEDRLKLTYKYMGVPGSPWKMYVSPEHQIMSYNNVLTGEAVYEHNMNDKKMLAIVKENMLSRALYNERSHLLVEKRKDLQIRKDHLHAKKVQGLYWRWKAACEMEKERWKLQQHMLSIMRKDEKRVALMWQTSFRKHMAKKRAWFRVQLHMEKKVDVHNGNRLYYLNHLTGDISWEPPRILFMFLGLKVKRDVEDPHPWSLQYDEKGALYWYNCVSGEKNLSGYFGEPPAKPSGYPLCLNCNIELAIKKCKQCDFEYCFQCFRASHNYVGADKHTYTRVQPIECEMCSKSLAAFRCKDKNFCKECFVRLETSGVFRNKKVVDL